MDCGDGFGGGGLETCRGTGEAGRQPERELDLLDERWVVFDAINVFTCTRYT